MTTKLKSYTIVPDSLYVERKADQQLHSIIEAMQRPGYVLVSRQMGKTNLLLRAKRKWENTEDLYVYIDMSNIDETEKECFESLIDTAIDTHENLLSHIREKIAELRRINITKSPVQAHNEELRTLLKAVKGKLVFILDEIDSLTRTPFSDNIFSQIRSVYFSRVNYPVLEKLTYVLSGVVEPTEIIKNPKISPFNIGEKILLDDFSYDEYRTFINKADLNELGEDVINRVFEWAGGNPRITWDICYELQFKEEINVLTVDTLIKEMYLTSFDKAPVDTIRNLVKEDRDLRDAIIQLAFNKGQTLSDKIKNKLYLSGIINYDDKDIHIKNRIINASLSLKWLQKIEEEEKGLLTYAIELHNKGYYQESIKKFEIYLKNNEFPEGNAPYYYYYMGSCFYHLQNFTQSLKSLTFMTLDFVKAPYEYRHSNFLAGADCLKLSRFNESLRYFNNAMLGEVKDWVYYSAKLNSLTARQQLALASGNIEEMRNIEQSYSELMALPEEGNNADIKLYAAIQLAAIYKTNNKQKACEIYDAALQYANDSARIRLLVDKFEVVEIEKQKDLLDELISSIEHVDEVANTLDPDNNLDLDEKVFSQALFLIYIYRFEKWDDIRGKLSLLPYSYGDALYHVFLQTFISNIYFVNESSRLIKEIYDNLNSASYNISSNLRVDIYKYNAFFNYTVDYAQEYLNSFHETEEKIDSVGLLVVRFYTDSLLERKQYKDLCKLDWVIERYPSSLSHQDTIGRSLIEYALLVSYYVEADIISALTMGRLILSYIDDEIKVSEGRDKKTLTQIKEVAQNALFTFQERHKNIKVYGRNEKVKVRYLQTQKIEIMKYKQVERDLEKGNCIIIDEIE